MPVDKYLQQLNHRYPNIAYFYAILGNVLLSFANIFFKFLTKIASPLQILFMRSFSLLVFNIWVLGGKSPCIPNPKSIYHSISSFSSRNAEIDVYKWLYSYHVLLCQISTSQRSCNLVQYQSHLCLFYLGNLLQSTLYIIRNVSIKSTLHSPSYPLSVLYLLHNPLFYLGLTRVYKQ